MKTTSTLLLTVLLCCLSKVNAQQFTPSHKVVIEDQTICATGYGIFCPRGIVYIDSFVRGGFNDMSEIISVHSNYYAPPNDAMYDSLYAGACFSNAHVMCNAWPQLMIDRKLITDPDSIFYDFNLDTGDSGVADITVEPVYNSNTRALDVTATAHFAVNAIGYRLAMVLTEDSVHGTTINYSQQNAYGNNANGPMADPGINFAAQPDTVPADLMYYRHVSRGIYPSFTGAIESLPFTLYADSTYSYTFPTYMVPDSFNASNMRAIVLLLQTSTGQIKNANGANLADSVAGVHQLVNATPSFSVFPNPFNSETSLKISLPSAAHISILLSDIIGKTLSTRDMGLLSSGDHLLSLNGIGLSAGIYFVTLKTENHSVTQKIVLSR